MKELIKGSPFLGGYQPDERVFHFVNNWINVCIYYLVKISYLIDTIIPKKLNAIAIIVIKKIKLELTFSSWSLSL